MQDIQNKAIKTYLENIEFLKYNHQSLYERVSMLSTAIDNNQYKERYHLEYIKEDQEFDIFDSSNETYLYNRNPKKFIGDAVSNSNLDKVNSIDLLKPEIYNIKEPFNVDVQSTIQFKTLAKAQNDVFDFIKIFKKSTVYKNKAFKYLEKFIFIGTLLGTHIEPILNKLKLDFLLIYEYNLEIFRLSLFRTNYAKLSKNRKFLFSIMDETNVLDFQLKNFFNYAIRSNYMVKFYCTNYNIHDFFDRMLIVNGHQNPFGYNYWKVIDMLLEPSLSKMSSYPTLKTKKIYSLFKDTPVLILSAGPSFGKNLEWIKKNKSKFVIVAIGAVVTKLIDKDIIPDLIISVDADSLILNQFPDTISKKIDKIPFLASAATYNKVVERFNKENVILYEAMSAFKDNSEYLYGYSVGEVALKLTTILGAKEIYILGADLALDQTTGQTHEDTHIHNKKHEISDRKKEVNSFIDDGGYNMSTSTLPVKGNFRDKVITTIIYEKSIIAYNQIINEIINKHKDINIYNLNDGAYLKGSIPTKIEDINVNSSNKVNSKNIINQLNENSEVGFSQIDIKKYTNSIQELDTFIQMLEKLKGMKLKTYDNFNNQRGVILQFIQKNLSKYSLFFLDKIFITYFQTMEAYLGFQFNENLPNETSLIKKTNKVWTNHMIIIAEKFRAILLDVIKK